MSTPSPGADVYDRKGDKIGKVTAVATDTHDTTGQQAWLSVRTAWYAREALVPLQGTLLTEHGVQLPYDKQTVRDAPAVTLGSPDADRLYQHYQYDWDDSRAAESLSGDLRSSEPRPRR